MCKHRVIRDQWSKVRRGYHWRLEQLRNGGDEKLQSKYVSTKGTELMQLTYALLRQGEYSSTGSQEK
jgi:hypothetical protein